MHFDRTYAYLTQRILQQSQHDNLNRSRAVLSRNRQSSRMSPLPPQTYLERDDLLMLLLAVIPKRISSFVGQGLFALNARDSNNARFCISVKAPASNVRQTIKRKPGVDCVYYGKASTRRQRRFAKTAFGDATRTHNRNLPINVLFYYCN